MKVIYPNGKIYIGKDLTDTIDYFGSPDSKLIEKDFAREERKKFTVRKEMLFESEGEKKPEYNSNDISRFKHSVIYAKEPRKWREEGPGSG